MIMMMVVASQSYIEYCITYYSCAAIFHPHRPDQYVPVSKPESFVRVAI